MSHLQFPPSSPVHDGPAYMPFKKGAVPHVDLPTPNPSSTVGRLSPSNSPVREHFREWSAETGTPAKTLSRTSGDLVTPTRNPAAALASFAAPHITNVLQKTVAINRDFNILNPQALVVRVPLYSTRRSVVVGRSSKSCDYAVAGDRRVSRKHVAIHYSPTRMVLTCTGQNGFGVVVPRSCTVAQTGPLEFELSQSRRPLVAQGVSLSVRFDVNHTEFFVARHQQVTMPRFENVLLQVGGALVLVNPDDCEEELTEDEAEAAEATEATVEARAEPEKVRAEPEQVRAEATAEPKEARDATATPVVRAEQGQNAEVPSEESVPSVVSEPSVVPVSTPAVPPSESLVTPREAQLRHDPATPHKAIRKHVEEPTPSKPTKAKVLAPRNINVPEATLKRRAKSEEPQSEPKKRARAEHDEHGKLIIDKACIANVKGIDEVENILVNHLAFSRLSSTPASFLNTILAAVARLSLSQLRAVLHRTSCIGVIYREGKDAAGKPLEEEYYYIPENDHDPERTKLVSLIRGHGGLRACRKTHKQYYWKRPAPIKK